MLLLIAHATRHHRVELGLVAHVAAEAEAAVGGEVAPLPLARRVVHERDQPQGRVAHQRHEQLQHVRIGELQAQMQEMVGLERLRRPGPAQHVDRQIEIVQPLALAAVEADADRVADGGDAGRGHLGVVRQHRRVRRPAYAWARGEQSLEIVGVQLDQARQQPVASQIRRCRRLPPSITSAIRPSRTTSVPATTASSVTIRALVRTARSPCAPLPDEWRLCRIESGTVRCKPCTSARLRAQLTHYANNLAIISPLGCSFADVRRGCGWRRRPLGTIIIPAANITTSW